MKDTEIRKNIVNRMSVKYKKKKNDIDDSLLAMAENKLTKVNSGT